MNQCWPDGVLRAFLDRELPAADLSRISAHLKECARCSERSRELAARAERVQGMLQGLAEPAAGDPLPFARPIPMPVQRRRTSRWVAGAAAALAAGWAAMALFAPKPVHAPLESPVEHRAAVEKPAVAGVPAPSVPVPAVTARLPVQPSRRELPRRAAPTVPAAPPRATLAGFVALDDDPIEAGVVMRVALPDGRMQADVLYSQDGRPRAFRLVNGATGK